MLGTDGKLYLLYKEQLAGITREKSLMPKFEATPGEMRDLVAYLGDAKGTVAAAETGRGVPFSDMARPKPSKWPTYHGNLERESLQPARQINTANVARLASSLDVPISRARARARKSRRWWWRGDVRDRR